MRVESVDVKIRDYPLTKPFTIASGTIIGVPQVFVTLVVSDGKRVVKGFGHNSISPIWSDRRAVSLDEKLDQEMRCIKDIANDMTRFEFEDPFGFYNKFCRGKYEDLPDLAYITTVSPFDLALWDAYGKMFGRNVFDLDIKNMPGGIPRNPEIMYTFGVGDVPASVRRVIEEYGISSIKMKLTGNPEKDAESVNRISSVDGVNNIVADANESYKSIRDLKYFIKHAHVSLDGLFAIETPFPRDSDIDINALETNIPVIADENLVTHNDVEGLNKLGYKVLALKPSTRTFAGFLSSLGEARKRGMKCVVMDLTTGPPIGYAVQIASASKMGGVLTEANGRQFYNWDGLVDRGFPGEEYRDAFYVKNGRVDPSIFLEGTGWGISEKVFNTYRDMSD